jgi:hypothetical protein
LDIIPAMDTMDVEREPARAPDVTVFRLKGPFVLGTMFEFQAALREPALKGVSWSQTQRNGYKFALAGISARVRTIFEITHTDTVLPIFATQADAEASMSKAAGA